MCKYCRNLEAIPVEGVPSECEDIIIVDPRIYGNEMRIEIDTCNPVNPIDGIMNAKIKINFCPFCGEKVERDKWQDEQDEIDMINMEAKGFIYDESVRKFVRKKD